jgi:peptidoglycan/xylan/chitin deacetylase (PgdA/CDA1 family)
VRRSFRDRAQRALKRAAGASDHLWSQSPGIVVLAYHRVGARSSAAEIDLPEDRFEAQMAHIAHECDPIDLDEALVALHQAPAEAGDRVVVTFDDGTADFVDVALPILERYAIPAILYVATEFVDRGQPFPNDGIPVSWAALRDATSTGLVTIGSHTHTHCLLDRVDAATASDELQRSRDLIAEHIGAAPEHFAYPKALVGTGAVEDVVRATFWSAAVAGTRANRYGRTDPWRLARSPVQRADGMRFFEQKLSGGLRLEDDVRRVVNRVRYIGAST